MNIRIRSWRWRGLRRDGRVRGSASGMSNGLRSHCEDGSDGPGSYYAARPVQLTIGMYVLVLGARKCEYGYIHIIMRDSLMCLVVNEHVGEKADSYGESSRQVHARE